MSRSARLLDLIQLLRRHRRPVTAARIAAELGISERTAYRDVATLAAQGVPVQGAAGVGYLLRPGALLPPLAFKEDEVEALVLGLRWVAGQGDGPLSQAAADAMAKIADIRPDGSRDAAYDTGLLAGAAGSAAPGEALLPVLRQAIRAERKLHIAYVDGRDTATERTVWPFALGFFEQVRVLAAWCEMRSAMRHFRTDRITHAEPLPNRYPRHRRDLLAEWRTQEGVPERL